MKNENNIGVGKKFHFLFDLFIFLFSWHHFTNIHTYTHSGLEPGSVVKTACTGRTEDDLYFPVSVVLRRLELGSALEYAASAHTEMVPSISGNWFYNDVLYCPLTFVF